MYHVDWLWNFLLSFFAPRIAARIGPLILMIFFGMLVFGFVYVYLFIPETKGLSLEEVSFILKMLFISPLIIDTKQVDELYRSGVKPWQSSGWRPVDKHLHDDLKAESVPSETKEITEKEENA